MLSFRKKDRYGQIIKPGDVCARVLNDKVELVVYRGEVWGAKTSKGDFGRFISINGPRSLKYSSVVFVFDPLSERRARTPDVISLTRKFYEERK